NLPIIRQSSEAASDGVRFVSNNRVLPRSSFGCKVPCADAPTTTNSKRAATASAGAKMVLLCIQIPLWSKQTLRCSPIIILRQYPKGCCDPDHWLSWPPSPLGFQLRRMVGPAYGTTEGTQPARSCGAQ